MLRLSSMFVLFQRLVLYFMDDLLCPFSFKPGIISDLVFCSISWWPIPDAMLPQFKQVKTEIVTASKVAYRFLAGIASNSQRSPDNQSSNRNSPRLQVSWFKNLIPAGDKPSTSSVLEGPNQDVIRQQQQLGDEASPPLRQNSRRDSWVTWILSLWNCIFVKFALIYRFKTCVLYRLKWLENLLVASIL